MPGRWAPKSGATGLRQAAAQGAEPPQPARDEQGERDAHGGGRAGEAGRGKRMGGRAIAYGHSCLDRDSARRTLYMSRTPRTKTDAALADAEQAHTDDPERAEVLARARRFKASWIPAWGKRCRASVEAAAGRTGARLLRGLCEGRAEDSSGDGRQAHRLLTASSSAARLPCSSATASTRAIPSYQAVDFLRRAEASDEAPKAAVEEYPGGAFSTRPRRSRRLRAPTETRFPD